MPKLPGVRHQDAVRVFEKLGFRIIRQSGHIVMSNGETRLTIPRANPVDPYTGMAELEAVFGLPEGGHPGIWFRGRRARPGVWR